MAKFCGECGKEIKKGEVCTCSTKTENFDFQSLLKEAFFKPNTFIKNQLNNLDFLYGNIMIAAVSAVMAFFITLLVNAVLGAFSASLGMFSSFLAVNVNNFEIFLKAFLAVVAILYLETGIVYLFNRYIVNKEIDYKKINMVVGLNSVYMGIFIILAIIFSFISVNLSILFILSGLVFKLINTPLCLVNLLKVDKEKIAYMYVIHLVVIFILSLLI